jgi:ACT domain-containing protein
MIYTISLILYVQLKEDRKGRQKEVLEAVKQRDINIFTIIKSHENHHVIIDKHSEILGYYYHIKDDLLRILKEITEDLSHMEVNTGN